MGTGPVSLFCPTKTSIPSISSIVIGLILLFVGLLINVARKFARLLKAGSWGGGGKRSARMIGFKKTHML